MVYVEGYYVTEDGEVFVDRTDVVITNQYGSFNRNFGFRKLKGSIDSKGYLYVKGSKEKRAWVARLVAKAFVSNDNPDNNVVNHLDGNKLNNKASNLEWTTQKGNCQHAVDTGLKTYCYGEEHVNNKYSEDVVRQVYLLAKAGKISQDNIGRMFGMPQIVASNIKTKKSWKNFTDMLDGETRIDGNNTRA